MNKGKIGPDQLAGLVFLSLLTLGTETLPTVLSAVGSAAWLCPLAAGGILWPLAGVLTPGPIAGRALLSGAAHPIMARITAAGLLLWGVVVTAGQADRVGRRLSGDLRGSAVLLSAAALLLAAWMASGGPAALGRAGEIFLMAVGLTCFMIVLFGLPGLRWDRIVLWTGEELRKFPAGVVNLLGELSVGLYALLFLEDPEPGRERKGLRLGRLTMLFPLLALEELLVLGRLGPGLAGAADRPFLQMVSGLGFQGAFQRLEEMVSALWLPGDLTLLALLLLSQRRLLSLLLKREEAKTPVWLPALAGLGAMLLRLPGSDSVLRFGGLAAGMILGCLAMISKKSEKIEKGG